MRRTTTRIAVLLFAFGAISVCAQEPDIDKTPKHTLNGEAWRIPIGGILLGDQNGRRILVVSYKDSVLYLVETALAQHKPLALHFPVQIARGHYGIRVSNGLEYLVMSVIGIDTAYVYDTAIDSIVQRIPYTGGPGALGAISKVHDVVVLGNNFYRISSGESFNILVEASSSTISDMYAEVYSHAPSGLVRSYDVQSGSARGIWATGFVDGDVHRPDGSDWIYAVEQFSMNGQNRVAALGATVDSTILFRNFAFGTQEALPVVKRIGSSGTALSLDAFEQSPINTVYKIDAVSKTSRVILAHPFKIGERSMGLPAIVGSELDRYYVSSPGLNGAQDTLIAYRLVRSATSVPDTEVQGNPDPCTFTNAPAFIYNVLGEVVATVDIVDDQIAPHQLEALPQQPLWVVQGECVRRVR